MPDCVPFTQRNPFVWNKPHRLWLESVRDTYRVENGYFKITLSTVPIVLILFSQIFIIFKNIILKKLSFFKVKILSSINTWQFLRLYKLLCLKYHIENVSFSSLLHLTFFSILSISGKIKFGPINLLYPD